MYKLVVIDLDGTLLNSRDEITDKDKHAIKLLKEKGVEVLLASRKVS
jgi:hydroxymethylpyrimidine pyrophosphatase-like HAD family hydrolase